MEFEISELIRADEKARHDVEEAHRMKFELRQKIADAQKQISEQAWQQVHREVEEKKAELDAQISQVETENRKEYEVELNRLEAQYREKKEAWCEEIVRRCLSL